MINVITGSAIGVKTPLSKHDRFGYFDSNTEILAHEKQNLVNLMMTEFGERVIHYDLGMNLQHVLFEQASDTTKHMVTENIVDAVSKWLPHLTIKRVNVAFNRDDRTVGENEIKIELGFQLLDNAEMFDTIQLLISR